MNSIPLDGALLLFDRSRGLNVRVQTKETQHLRQRAPRTVMFGITNACNLACSFCSRDHAAASSWTVDSAFAFLSDLAMRGVAEVAFGGGEPFVFRDFDVLLERLWKHTPLALNVTTNGTLLTKERVARIARWVGEVRVSIYEENRWEDALRNLAEAGVSRGANVILTREAVPTLESLLQRVAAAGCRDVALLRYVGPDASEQLTRDDELKVEAIIARSPVRIRISTCFGDRFPTLPRLVNTGDCGAGEDFLVVTSDRRSKACSFQSSTHTISSAHSLVNAWSERRRQRERAPFLGCARPLSGTAEKFTGVRAWQAFSSNNSGDCVLVGQFEEVESAKKFLERLEEMITTPLAEGENPTWYDPEHIVASGRTISLHTESAVDDDFTPLRALLWNMGGVALLNGIHVHERVKVITALGFDSVAKREEAEVALEVDRLRCIGRETTIFIEHEWWELPYIEKIAAPRVSEVAECDEGELERAVAKPAPVIDGWWVFARIEEKWKLVRREPPFDGASIQAAGGLAQVIPGTAVRLRFNLWRKDGWEADPAAFPESFPGVTFEKLEVSSNWSRSLVGSVVPAEPERVLRDLIHFARERDLTLWIDAEAAERIGFVVARLEEALSLRARE